MAVVALAASQDEVLTRAQLAELGFTDDAVGSRTAHGIWQGLGPRVVVLHSGVLTPAQTRWTGVLHAEPGVVLALATAAEAGGLRGFEESEVHVAVEHGREIGDLVDPRVTVRVHQTRHVSNDVVRLRAPARQNVARATVELASLATSDNRARALIAAAVQQRLVRPDHLSSFVVARPTLPRRRLIRETIEDVAGGAHSLPELRYAQVLGRAGIPQPTRQRRVRRPSGVWYLDNDFGEWAVTVEINGIQHNELLAGEADAMRRGILQARGRIVVDISSYAVRHRPALAVLRTAEALLAHGYQPSPPTRAILAAYTLREGYDPAALDVRQPA